MYVLIGLAILVTSAQNLESDVREVIIHFNKFFAPSTLTTKIQKSAAIAVAVATL